MGFNWGVAAGAAAKEYQNVQNQMQQRRLAAQQEQMNTYKIAQADRDNETQQGIQQAGADFRNRMQMIHQAGQAADSGDQSGISAIARDFAERFNHDPTHSQEGMTMKLVQGDDGNATHYVVTDSKGGIVENGAISPQTMVAAARQEYLNNVASYSPEMAAKLEDQSTQKLIAQAHATTAAAAAQNAQTEASKAPAQIGALNAQAANANAEASRTTALTPGAIRLQSAQVGETNARAGYYGAEGNAANARAGNERLSGQITSMTLDGLKQNQALADTYQSLNDQNDPGGKQRAQLEQQMALNSATKSESLAQILRANRVGVRASNADDPTIKALANQYAQEVGGIIFDPKNPSKATSQRAFIDSKYPPQITGAAATVDPVAKALGLTGQPGTGTATGASGLPKPGGSFFGPSGGSPGATGTPATALSIGGSNPSSNPAASQGTSGQLSSPQPNTPTATVPKKLASQDPVIQSLKNQAASYGAQANTPEGAQALQGVGTALNARLTQMANQYGNGFVNDLN